MSEWRQTRLDALARPVNEVVDPRQLGSELVDHFSIPALDATGGPATEPASAIESNKQPLVGGEDLVSKLNPRKARVLSVPVEAERRMICSGEFIVLRPLGRSDKRFLEYLMLAESTRQLLDASVQSVTRSHQRVRPDVLTKLKVCVPSREEQRVIAEYLDAETVRIDALITKKRRMIELNSERLRSQIDAGMTPSAGDPSPPLSTVVQIAEGQVDPKQEPFVDMPLIAPNHIESSTGRLLDIETARSQGAISGKYICDAGDVIYSKIRPALRKVCLAPARCLTSADMYPMRPIGDLSPEFLFYLLLSERFSDFAVMESERVAMPKINRDAFGRIRIPLPSLAVQKKVVERLGESRRWAEQVNENLHRQIELLAERRQALITAAVTGELEIPGVAA